MYGDNIPIQAEIAVDARMGCSCVMSCPALETDSRMPKVPFTARRFAADAYTFRVICTGTPILKNCGLLLAGSRTIVLPETASSLSVL